MKQGKASSSGPGSRKIEPRSKAGVPRSVAKDFNAADKGGPMLKRKRK